MSISITLPRRQFAAALSRLNATAPRRSIREALQCARLSLSDRLELAATDCERVHTERLEPLSTAGVAAVDCLVNVAELAKAAGTSKAFETTLTVDAFGSVSIDGLRLSNAPSVAEFPKLSHLLDDCDAAGKPLQNIGGAIVDAAELASMIALTHFCTDTDASRYALGGCLFECSAGTLGGLRIVGTDGRRLSQVRTAAEPENAEREFSAAIVPIDGLRVIARQLAKTGNAKTAVVELFRRYAEPAPAEPQPVDNGLTVQPPAEPQPVELIPRTGAADYVRVATFDAAGNALSIVTTRTIDGRYPNWRQVMPRDIESRGTVRVDELAAISKRSASIVADDARGVRFSFRPSVCIVKTVQPNGRRVRDALRLSNVPPYSSPKTVRLTLDIKFVDELAKAAAGCGIKMIGVELQSDCSPVVFTLGGGGFYIVMPMGRPENIDERRRERCRRIDNENEAKAAAAAAELAAQQSAELATVAA